MNAPRRKVAVVGAGVIGQVYAARLAAAGCGDLGRFALAPHVMATRDMEFRRLAADARKLTGNPPGLSAALAAAGFAAEPPDPSVSG